MSDESAGRKFSLTRSLSMREPPPRSMQRAHFSRITIRSTRSLTPTRKRKLSSERKESFNNNNNAPKSMQRFHFSRINVTRASRSSVPFSEAAGKLPRFSASDPAFPVEAWVSRVAEDARIYGWTTRETLIAARWALVGPAEIWYRYQRAVYTWEELRRRLLEEFHRPLSRSEAEELLARRSRKSGECVLSYALEMEAIGAQAGLSQEEVRGYIVNGVTRNDLNKALLVSKARRKDFKYELLRMEFLWKNEPQIFRN